MVAGLLKNYFENCLTDNAKMMDVSITIAIRGSMSFLYNYSVEVRV